MPALLTQMSIPPRSATAASAVSVIDAVSVTSSRLAIIGAAVHRRELVGRRRRAGMVEVADQHRRARLGQAARDRPTQPTRATGDDRVPSRQGDQLAEGRVAQIRDGHVRSIARPPPDQQASNVASNLRQQTLYRTRS